MRARRLVRRAALTVLAIRPIERAQVHLLNGPQDRPHQVIVRHPIQQSGGINIVCPRSHAIKLCGIPEWSYLNPPDGTGLPDSHGDEQVSPRAARRSCFPNGVGAAPSGVAARFGREQQPQAASGVGTEIIGSGSRPGGRDVTPTHADQPGRCRGRGAGGWLRRSMGGPRGPRGSRGRADGGDALSPPAWEAFAVRSSARAR